MYKPKDTTIIFDYMRTIYSPEEKTLFASVIEVLEYLKQSNYLLYLVSRDEGQRKDDFETFHLHNYFEQIFLTTDKAKIFREIKMIHMRPHLIVVGDRVRGEICEGNAIGAHTVWLKQGKFSSEEPLEKKQQPHDTITALTELIDILER